MPTKVPNTHDHASAVQLAKLFERLSSDADFRRKFHEASDPRQTAAEAGLKHDHLNDKVIHTLAGLSEQEQKLLSELNTTLIDANLHVDINPKLMIL